MYKHASLPGTLLDRTDPLSQGLVGYWPMNEGAGTRANDIAVGKYPGTFLNGPGWGGSNSGAAVIFDGVDDYIETNLVLPNQFTISAWFASSANGLINRLIGNSDSVAGLTGVGIIVGYPSATYLYFVMRQGGNVSTYDIQSASISDLTQNKWHHVAVTVGGSGAWAYCNGVVVGSNVLTTQITGSLTLRIGRNGNGGDRFNGKAFGARVYNRALSAAEVMQLYQQPHAGLLSSRASTFSYLAFRAAWAARANQIIGGSTT